MEDSHVWYLVAVPQSGERSPGRLFREHGHQEIDRVHGRQQRQQMHAPELGRTEPPPWAAHRPRGPALVDELVRDVRIEQGEVLGGAGLRQRVHGGAGYPFQTVASGFSFPTSNSKSSGAPATTSAETCNTL